MSYQLDHRAVKYPCGPLVLWVLQATIAIVQTIDGSKSIMIPALKGPNIDSMHTVRKHMHENGETAESHGEKEKARE